MKPLILENFGMFSEADIEPDPMSERKVFGIYQRRY
jgi:hypothetical protein